MKPTEILCLEVMNPTQISPFGFKINSVSSSVKRTITLNKYIVRNPYRKNPSAVSFFFNNSSKDKKLSVFQKPFYFSKRNLPSKQNLPWNQNSTKSRGKISSVFALPVISLPLKSLPTFSLPPLTFPSLAVPVVSLPPLSLPTFSVPPLTLPSISVPVISVPSVSIPDISLPNISLPPLSFPPLSLPDISFPALSLPPSLSLPEGFRVPFLTTPIIVALAFTLSVKFLSQVLAARAKNLAARPVSFAARPENSLLAVESEKGAMTIYAQNPPNSVQIVRRGTSVLADRWTETNETLPFFRICFNFGILLCTCWSVLLLGWFLDQAWALFVILTANPDAVQLSLTFAKGSRWSIFNMKSDQLLRVAPLVLLVSFFVVSEIAKSVLGLGYLVLLAGKEIWVRADRIYEELPLKSTSEINGVFASEGNF